MAMELSGVLSMDASDMVGGLEDSAEAAEDAADSLEDTSDSVDDTADSLFDLESVDFGTIAAGLGTAGIAGAAQSALDETQPLREELGRVSEAVEPTNDELEDMVRHLSDETFSQDDVAATFGNLAELGFDSEEGLADLATTADTLADATGTTAEKVSGDLMPALRSMGEDPEDLEDHMDTLAMLSNETSLSLDDFERVTRKNAEELQDLGMGVDDTAAIFTELEERGLDSRTAMREFRQAAGDAEGDQEELLNSLGITAEEFEGQTDAIADAETGAEDYASAANESFSAADQLGAVVDDLTLQFSGIIGPISSLLPALAAGGAALAGLGSIGVTAGGAMGFLGTALTILTGPVGIAAAAIAGLAFLFREDLMEAFEDVSEFLFDDVIPPLVEFGEGVLEDVVMPAVEDAGDILEDVFGDMADAADDLIDAVGPPLESLFDGIVDFVTDALGVIEDAWDDHGDDIADEVDATIEAIEPPITSALGTVEDIVDTVLGEIEDFWDDHGDTIESIVDTLTDFWLDTFGNALDLLANIVLAGLNLIQGDWDGFRNAVSGIVDALWSQVENLFETGFEILDELTGGALSDIREAFGDLADWLRDTWDFVDSLLDPVRDAVELLIGNSIIPDLIADIKSAFNGIREWLGDVWDLNPLSDTFEAVADRITGGEEGIIGTLISDVKSPLSGLNSWIEDTFGVNLLEGFEEAFDAVTSWIEDTLTVDIGEAFGSVADEIGKKLSDISVDWPSLPDWLDDALDNVTGGIEDAIEWIEGQQPDGSGGGSGGRRDESPDDDDGDDGGSDDRRDESPDDDDGDDGGSSDQPDTPRGPGLDPGVLHTGGLAGQEGWGLLEAGERVLPESQVNDRGEASFDPDSVADGFDDSRVAREMRDRLDRIDDAIRDDGTVRVSDRDLVRALERLFDRHGASV